MINSEKEIINLFNDVEIATNKFSKLKKEILLKTKTIRIFRLILGLSQRNMAKKLGVKPVILSNLENEKRKITPKILDDIFLFFGK